MPERLQTGPSSCCSKGTESSNDREAINRIMARNGKELCTQYSSEEGGFINLGTLDIDLVEPALVTVVIRLGAAFPSSGWLLADAVKLEPVEAVE